MCLETITQTIQKISKTQTQANITRSKRASASDFMLFFFFYTYLVTI